MPFELRQHSESSVLNPACPLHYCVTNIPLFPRYSNLAGLAFYDLLPPSPGLRDMMSLDGPGAELRGEDLCLC